MPSRLWSRRGRYCESEACRFLNRSRQEIAAVTLTARSVSRWKISSPTSILRRKREAYNRSDVPLRERGQHEHCRDIPSRAHQAQARGRAAGEGGRRSEGEGFNHQQEKSMKYRRRPIVRDVVDAIKGETHYLIEAGGGSIIH